MREVYALLVIAWDRARKFVQKFDNRKKSINIDYKPHLKFINEELFVMKINTNCIILYNFWRLTG